ncbi:E3 SUMO-protein ligase ZBED1-like [Choristoneura fumiferana]|uniref:E3 SUMO-protein ligase ZBED1-like n=1 Tax=Choristoneura fumiferana TaxID=7141 RepID=UPI003D157DF9
MAPSKGKRSNVWFHYNEDADQLRAKCNYCGLYLSIKSGSLGNLSRHMKNKHPTIPLCVQRQPAQELSNEEHLPTTSAATAAAAPSTSSAVPSSSTMNLASTSTSTYARPGPGTTLPISNYFRKPPSTRKVVKGHHALRIVEEPEFKIFIEMVSHCPGYQLPTRKTLSNTLIPKIYMEVFQDIQRKIADTPAVCLGTDGWTSTTTESYIAVTAHFIDERTTTLSSVLLGCIKYNERHTSANLMSFLKDIIRDWQISHKIGSIVSDNAANITTAIRMGGWRPIGCFAHSLNLMVQRALTDISEVVGKVKAIVEFFKRSSNGLHKLLEAQNQMGLPPLKLKQECPTRWNSCYDMLERVLRLQNAVITTLAAIMRQDLLLQPHHWAIIEAVVPILKPFYEITTEVSADKMVTLSKVLVFVQLMERNLAAFTAQQYEVDEITVFVATLKEQLRLRFHDLEKNALYADSTILDPRFKKKGFRTEDSFLKASELLKRRICEVKLPQVQQEENISATAAPSLGSATFTTSSTEPQNAQVASIWDEFDKEMAMIIRPENNTAAAIREYDHYMREPYLPRKDDPLKWWHKKKEIYPRVYQYMLKRLEMQATSVSCERVFPVRKPKDKLLHKKVVKKLDKLLEEENNEYLPHEGRSDVVLPFTTSRSPPSCPPTSPSTVDPPDLPSLGDDSSIVVDTESVNEPRNEGWEDAEEGAEQVESERQATADTAVPEPPALDNVDVVPASGSSPIPQRRHLLRPRSKFINYKV